MSPEGPKKPLGAADRIIAIQQDEQEQRRLAKERTPLVVAELNRVVEEQYLKLCSIDSQFGFTASLQEINEKLLSGREEIIKCKNKHGISFEIATTPNGREAIDVRVPREPNAFGDIKSPFISRYEEKSSFYSHYLSWDEWTPKRIKEIKGFVRAYISLRWGEHNEEGEEFGLSWRSSGGNRIHLVYGENHININGGRDEKPGNLRDRLYFDPEFQKRFQGDPEFEDEFRDALAKAYRESHWFDSVCGYQISL